jgi:hypothetical protein
MVNQIFGTTGEWKCNFLCQIKITY